MKSAFYSEKKDIDAYTKTNKFETPNKNMDEGEHEYVE